MTVGEKIMDTHGFTLLIEGIPASEAGFLAFANTLYESAPDSTVSADRIGFDRDANSLLEAVASAISSVHRADPTVTVVGVELDDGQTLDELLGLSLPESACAAGGK